MWELYLIKKWLQLVFQLVYTAFTLQIAVDILKLFWRWYGAGWMEMLGIKVDTKK